MDCDNVPSLLSLIWSSFQPVPNVSFIAQWKSIFSQVFDSVIDSASEIITEFILFFLFAISYEWSSRPAIVISNKSVGVHTQGCLSLMRILAYVFLLMFLYYSFYYCFLSQNPSLLLFSSHIYNSFIFQILVSIFLLLSVVLFIQSFLSAGLQTLSAKPSEFLFTGIYHYCRNPQTLALILFLIYGVFLKNSVAFLFVIVGVITVLIHLAKYVCIFHFSYIILHFFHCIFVISSLF